MDVTKEYNDFINPNSDLNKYFNGINNNYFKIKDNNYTKLANNYIYSSMKRMKQYTKNPIITLTPRSLRNTYNNKHIYHQYTHQYTSQIRRIRNLGKIPEKPDLKKYFKNY